MSYPDNSFDLVWGCESGEHTPSNPNPNPPSPSPSPSPSPGPSPSPSPSQVIVVPTLLNCAKWTQRSKEDADFVGDF